MTDIGTMMALMNLLGGMKSGGTESGKADMSAMLPVLLGMLNAKNNGTAENADGVPSDGMSRLLPILMNMMKPGGAQPAGAAPPRESGANTSPYGSAQNAQRTRTYAETPFGDIGFAGAEVRSFMETLWRLRSRR